MQKGGAERVIATLSNELARNNDVVIVSLIKNRKDQYPLSKTIKRISIDKRYYEDRTKISKKIAKLSLRRLISFREILEAEKPDVVVSFLPEPTLRLMLVKRYSKILRNIPVIVSIRNDPKKEYANSLIKNAVKNLYKNADAIVFQTEEARLFFQKIIKTKQQAIIKNPISDNFFIKPKKDNERKNTIISVGRLEQQKNHELLIKAFSSIKDKRQFKLEIYGEGSLKTRLQELINDLHLNDCVQLKGQTDSIQSYLNSSKIFVLSSNYEGMPNALMEAMALGLPCIATDCPCGGPRELIKSGENGILVPLKKPEKMRQAIEELMNEPEKRAILGKNALYVRKAFDPEKIVSEWGEIINRVLKERQ